MEGYPGATRKNQNVPIGENFADLILAHLDLRQAFPKPVQEYWVTLLPQSDIQHTVHLWNGEEFEVPPPPESKIYDPQQPSEAEAKDLKTSDWGPTTRCPLGYIAHARSGDKGSNANVGFW